MKTSILRCLLGAVLLGGSLAAAPVNLTELEIRIERAALRVDAAAARQAITELDAALATDAKSPALLYLRGYAEYAAANALRAVNDRKGSIKSLETAVAFLERVEAGTVWHAEAQGFAASIYGQLIGLKGGVAGMTLGPKSGDLLNAAAQAAPNSPRVLFFRGTSKLNTPPDWGGSPAEGLKLLQESVAGFAQQDDAVDGPHWGRAEALVWLGLAQQKLGDIAAAREAWTQALALEPEYTWVNYVLLPSVKEKS